MGRKLIYSINGNFFKSWGSKMAYILGFIFADGRVEEQTLAIEIRKSDKEQLERINRAMNSNYPLKLTKNKKAIRLRISNPLVVGDLKKFGLNKNKFYRKLPAISTQYFRDFLRGFCDGDGWIVVNSRKREISIGIASANKLFLQELVRRLNSQVKLTHNNLRMKRKITKTYKISISYQIEWYGKNAIAIIKYLYDNLKKDELFLLRKYNKQLKARNIFNKVKRNNRRINIEENFKKSIRTILKNFLNNEDLVFPKSLKN